jgi:hypothetical protein
MGLIENDGARKPLAIDLYCGLGGWTEGLLAEGYYVVGFDNVHHQYGTERYPGELVIQDVLTLHGRQFQDAALIVGSSPCQEFSYRAMPWKRAKAMPPPWLGIALFEAQFRIQAQASAAAGRHIPLVVENVRGAIPWVGRSRWNFGSFHLWGDVPALMPMTKRVLKGGWHSQANGAPMRRDDTKNTGGSWFGEVGNNPVKRNDPRDDGRKLPGQDWNKFKETGEVSQWNYLNEKGLEPGIKCGGDWFGKGNQSPMREGSSGSTKRKAASALIAKIPLPLARHIARVYYPVANLEKGA